MIRPRLLVLLAAAIAAVLLVLYVIWGGTQTVQPPPALAALKLADDPAPAPRMDFADTGGRAYRLENYKGRYVLLNLWASWCAPCVRELPALARLQRAIPSGKLFVLTVDVEKDAAKLAAQFLIEHDAADLPAFVDPGRKLMRQSRTYGLPTTLLIDPEGREIGRAVGPAEWDAPEAISYFEMLTASVTASR